MFEATQKRLVKRLPAEACRRQARSSAYGAKQCRCLGPGLLTSMRRKGLQIVAKVAYVKHLKRNSAKPVACLSQHET
jgi:hypothetical protein